MADLSVSIAGVQFKNPVIAASGCFGFGLDYEDLYPVSALGGVSLKGTTLDAKPGNIPPRIAETYGGMLNSVGLQNPGVDKLINVHLPALCGKDTVKIANIAGKDVDTYIRAVEKVSDSCADMIELNISCPNVKEGGLAFGASPDTAAALVKEVRKVCKKPLMVKLSPNVTDIVSIARAVEAEGADALSLINTLLGMRIDIRSRKPILHNNVGGMSGRAVFPVALRMVWQTAKAVSIPVVGMGGIATWEDAVEMLLAGASALQVGAAIFTDPYAPVKIVAGLNKWLDDNNIKCVSDIVGQVECY